VGGDLAAGSYFFIAATPSGTLYCWHQIQTLLYLLASMDEGIS